MPAQRSRSSSKPPRSEGRTAQLATLSAKKGGNANDTWSEWDQYNAEVEGTESITQAYKLSRKWAGSHWYLQPILGIRTAVANFGCRVQGLPGGAEMDDPYRVSLEPAQAAVLTVEQAIREYLVQGCLIAVWRKAQPGVVNFVPPESVKYSDTGGHEMLEVQLPVDGKVLEAMPPAVRRRYEGGRWTYGDAAWQNFNLQNPLYAEGFAVFKSTPRGHGLGMPALHAFFRPLGQSDSMEVGESEYAFAGRLVIRQHKIGHEIKSGPLAGLPKHFYKRDRAEAIKKDYQSATGFREGVTNFDHSIGIVWNDQKPYEVKKWGTVLDRLRWWAGGIGQVLDSRSANPDLMGLLEAEYQSLRGKLRPWLQQVLARAWQVNNPSAVKIRWGVQCFRNQRLFAEMLKFGVQAGPVSVTTLTEQTLGEGESETERERKKEERRNPEDFLPLYDPNHGNAPGRTGGKPALSKPGGRPAEGQMAEPDDALHVGKTAPEAARRSFRRGIAQVEKGLGGDGLEPATVKEARSLAAGEAPTEAKIRKANRWWARNERFLDAEADTPADVAANLWGGPAGRDWFRALAKNLEE